VIIFRSGIEATARPEVIYKYRDGKATYGIEVASERTL